MERRGRVVVHIGTHRTGTTSIQQFLRDQSRLLADADVWFPVGLFHPNNHLELEFLAIRPERRPRRSIERRPETLEEGWRIDAVQIRGRGGAPTVVYSAESLSCLRFDDEAERLVNLLDGRDIGVVMYVREPAAFLRSYRFALEAAGFPTVIGPGVDHLR